MKRTAWLKMPASKLGQFCYGFVDQFIFFFLACANMRAVALALKSATVATDMMITITAFTSKKFAIDKEEARTWYVGAGETIGGGLGSLLSIWVTQRIFGR